MRGANDRSGGGGNTIDRPVAYLELLVIGTVVVAPVAMVAVVVAKAVRHMLRGER